MFAPVENTTAFTGILVQRRYKPGQKYIQLLFQTTEGLRLSITRNVELVRSLSEGYTYRIKGPEYVVGQKTYVKEPTATLVLSEAGFIGRHRKLIAIAAVFIAITGTASAKVFTSNDSSNLNQAGSKNVTTQQQTTDASNTTKVESATTTQEQPAATPPASTPTTTKKSTTQKTTPAVSTDPSSTTPTQETPAVTPPADPPANPPADPPADPPVTPPPETPQVP